MNSISRRSFVRASVLAGALAIPTVAMASEQSPSSLMDKSASSDGGEYDFSFLDEMSDDELKALRDELAIRLGSAQTSPMTAPSDGSEGTDEQEASSTVEEVPVYWNTPIETDDYAFTLTGAEWADAIYPPDTSGGYSYYEPQSEGTRYLLVRGVFENKSSDTINVEDVTLLQITINGEYNFTGATVMAKDGSDDFYSFNNSPMPLETVNIYLFAEIPDKMIEQCQSIKCVWSFGEELTKRLSLSMISDGDDAIATNYIIAWDIA